MCVNNKIEIEILCACCGAVWSLRVFVCVCLCVHCAYSLLSYWLPYTPTWNMPSSMVKYVSKKYLCANNGMRNERNVRRDKTHIMWMQPALNSEKRWKCETNREICYLCNHKNVLKFTGSLTLTRFFAHTHTHSLPRSPFIFFSRWRSYAAHNTVGHGHHYRSFITQQNELELLSLGSTIVESWIRLIPLDTPEKPLQIQNIEYMFSNKWKKEPVVNEAWDISNTNKTPNFIGAFGIQPPHSFAPSSHSIHIRDICMAVAMAMETAKHIMHLASVSLYYIHM